MTGEGIDGTNKLDQAKEAVEAATQTVKATTRSVAGAIEGGQRPGSPLDRLARWAQEAPLHAGHGSVLGRCSARAPPQVIGHDRSNGMPWVCFLRRGDRHTQTSYHNCSPRSYRCSERALRVNGEGSPTKGLHRQDQRG